MSRAVATARPLTDKQQAFVKHVLDGVPQIKAAELAGYSDPDASSYSAVRVPHVRRAIMEGLATRLATEAAPVSYRVLMKVVQDETVSPRVRVDAGKALLDRAGFVPPKAAEPEGVEKSLSDMNRDELRAFIDQAERQLANEAIDVTPPTVEAEDDA
jgi:hypothetical protein